ncbi:MULTISPECIES: hypothetical protein [unclassified Rhodococcus (in: high G+C Gram-positive bacteria)]|uniref:hypothetical protein n=1 Tax=unclassified Rhodococcus (in: high G+C Gram-positive bacteria) TaxID=192944 RepID=UPI00339337D6
MTIYTAELRWGPAPTVWLHDPQIRMTCRSLDELDELIADRLLVYIADGNEDWHGDWDEDDAILQIVADTEHGSFTLAEFTGTAADIEQNYQTGRQRGFRAAGAKTPEEVDSLRQGRTGPQ